MYRIRSPLRQKVCLILGLIDFDWFGGFDSVELILMNSPFLNYSWSLLLLQQPVGCEDIHHHVWSHQHVLLSCHGTSLLQARDSPKVLVLCLHYMSTRCLCFLLRSD